MNCWPTLPSGRFTPRKEEYKNELIRFVHTVTAGNSAIDVENLNDWETLIHITAYEFRVFQIRKQIEVEKSPPPLLRVNLKK